MKLAFENPEVLVGGKRESSDFKFKASGHAFKILSDSLYSDKVRAIVRELCTNAWDSHKASNKESEPFDIHFPSVFDPFFHVRDYGTGLSHNDVMNLYTTFFESTKNDSNDFIGALGLGSKSPFAYTDQFVVESWFEGEHNTYSAYVGDQGTPQCVHLSTKPCDVNDTGLKVIIPVEERDCKDGGIFTEKAKLVLPPFSVMPNLLNLDERYRNSLVDLHTTFWENFPAPGESKFVDFSSSLSVFGEGRFPWFIRQGNVVYPVDVASIENREEETDSDEFNKILSWFMEYVRKVHESSGKFFITHVSMGGASIAPSREALSYDTKTSDLVIDAVKRLKSDVAAVYTEAFRAYDTMPEMLSAIRKVEKELVLVPGWLQEEVAPFPSKYRTEEGNHRWFDLSLAKQFPDLKGVSIGDILLMGGKPVPPMQMRISVEGQAPRVDNFYPRPYLYDVSLRTLSTNGIGSGGLNFNYLNRSSFIENSSDKVKMVICDRFETLSQGAKFIQNLSEYYDGNVSNDLIVFNLSRDAIKHIKDLKSKDGRNIAGHQFELVDDLDLDALSQKIKEYIPAIEWAINGKVILLSEHWDELEKRRRADVRAKAADNDDGSLFITNVNGVEDDFIAHAEKSEEVFILRRKGSNTVLYGEDDHEFDISEIRPVFMAFMNGFGFKKLIFSPNKSEMGKIKKSGYADKCVDILDHIAKSIQVFASREPKAIDMVRSMSLKYKVRREFIHIYDSTFLRNYTEVFDGGTGKAHIDRVNSLMNDIFGGPDNTIRGVNGTDSFSINHLFGVSGEMVDQQSMVRAARLTRKVKFFINHHKDLSRLNAVTKDHRFFPLSKKAIDFKQSINSLTISFKQIHQDLDETYPLAVSSLNNDMDEITKHHVRLYISAVDAANASA